ncbi:MAG: hypothetical protein ABIL91_07595 [candidate division WOR-3 bacterium]
MEFPIISPFSVSLIERIELDFNITEGTYIEQRASSGKLCITPKLKPKDYESFRNAVLKLAKNLPSGLKQVKEELEKFNATPYTQYVNYLDPPSPIISRLFKKRGFGREGEFEHEILLGYLLIGGAETVNFSEKPPISAHGVVPVKTVVSKGKLVEVEKEAKKEIGPKEYSYTIDFEKIKQLIENIPEIRKELFLRKTSFEIKEPLWIEPSAYDAPDIFPKLDGKGPRGQIYAKVAEYRDELKKKGLSEDEIAKKVVWYTRHLEERIWEEAKEYEKFYGLTALALSLKNVSSFPIEGDIFIEELSLNFPIGFSKYYFYTNVVDPNDPNTQIVSKYDPVRMQAVWNNVWLKKYKDKAREIPHEGVTLYLLVPHEELSKVHKITGEIRMQVMIGDISGPPLASLLYLQEICDARGIPVKSELEDIGNIDIRTSATSQVTIDPSSIYLRKIARTRVVSEFEGVHPERAHEVIIKLLESLGCDINHIDGPEISSGIEKDYKELTSWIKCTKYVEVTPIYVDIMVQGKIFTTVEAKALRQETFRRKVENIPREHGDTKITVKASSPNSELLKSFVDELQAELREVISSLKVV